MTTLCNSWLRTLYRLDSRIDIARRWALDCDLDPDTDEYLRCLMRRRRLLVDEILASCDSPGTPGTPGTPAPAVLVKIAALYLELRKDA
jgi:hypothetical protein